MPQLIVNGPSVATSALGAARTLIAAGDLAGGVATVQISQGSGEWAPVAEFSSSGRLDIETISVLMRAIGPAGAVATIDVEGPEATVTAFIPPVPAGVGVGASIAAEIGEPVTAIVDGDLDGAELLIEGSVDNVSFEPLFLFTAEGQQLDSFEVSYVRVRVGGNPGSAFSVIVTLGAALNTGPPSGPAGGDLTGSTYPAPLVSRPRLTYVFQPGGVAVGNVYTDFGLLYAALQAARPFGEAQILFDDSIVSPCVVPAAAYDMTGVLWKGASLTATTAVIIANGATFVRLLEFERIYLDNQSPLACPLNDGDAIALYEFANVFATIPNTPLYDASGLTSYIGLSAHHNAWFAIWEEVMIAGLPNGAAIYAQLYDSAWLGGNAIEGVVGSSLQVLILSPSAFMGRQDNFFGTFSKTSRAYPEFNLRPEMGQAPATAPIGGTTVEWGDWLRMNATAGVIAQSLPRIRSVGVGEPYNDGKVFIVTEISGVNPLSMSGYGTDTINGAPAAYIVPPGGTVLFISDGVNDSRTIALDRNAILNILNVFNAAQGSALRALADATPNINPDLSLSNSFRCDLGVVAGNTRQLNIPTGMVAGFTYILEFVQPGAGATQALTYNATWWKFPGGVIPTLTATNGAKDIISFWYDGDAMQCVIKNDSRNP